MARFLTIVLLLHVSLMVVALVDCLSAPERGIRSLPRAAWIFLILLASPVGAFAWILLGKPLSPAPPRPVRRHGVERRRSMRPFGPEDDAAFIAGLAANLRRVDGD
ncbi:PLDc N-terminal domain-containing protein [Actinoplanes sp. NPDC051411]|uniref:PLDc N-terminal domain-containing protein n=1 Tax=Actinoplanes sp. NPDC051411 TaxID=3155522 RepID=UPI0034263266